jgi:hypothetical protein
MTPDGLRNSSPPVIHTPGPPLPPELNHELLTEIGWTIGDESSSVIRWHKRLRAAVNVEPIDSDWDDHWDAILGILNHSAVLSRVFWPATNPRCDCADCMAREKAAERDKRNRLAVRGTFLRSLFNVQDDSPLNEEGRRLRNSIEHWDERLDGSKRLYREINAAKGAYKLWIGSLDNVPPGSYPVRAYDPAAEVVACGRTRMPLRPLAREAYRINEWYAHVVGFMVHGDPIWCYLEAEGTGT